MEFHIVKDDVVISGIGGSFPKSKDVRELTIHLLNNENLLTSRWGEGIIIILYSVLFNRINVFYLHITFKNLCKKVKGVSVIRLELCLSTNLIMHLSVSILSPVIIWIPCSILFWNALFKHFLMLE